MQPISFEELLECILAKDKRFDRAAYLFVREALDHTQKSTAKENRRQSQGHSHVSGQQLLDGIKEHALTQYGPMAMMLLDEWGVHQCRDFGEIVFNMVDVGLLAKRKEDCRADFEDGYDFFEAFRKPYLPTEKLPRRETAPARPANA